MATFLVELSVPPAAVLDVQADLLRVHALTGGTQHGAPVAARLLHAAYIPSRETCISFMDAPDLETVSALFAQAGLRARVQPAVALS